MSGNGKEKAMEDIYNAVIMQAEAEKAFIESHPDYDPSQHPKKYGVQALWAILGAVAFVMMFFLLCCRWRQ